MKWTKTKDRLYKLTKEFELVAADDEKNEPIKTDIKIKGLHLNVNDSSFITKQQVVVVTRMK